MSHFPPCLKSVIEKTDNWKRCTSGFMEQGDDEGVPWICPMPHSSWFYLCIPYFSTVNFKPWDLPIIYHKFYKPALEKYGGWTKRSGKPIGRRLQEFLRDSHADTMTLFPEPFSDMHELYRHWGSRQQKASYVRLLCDFLWGWGWPTLARVRAAGMVEPCALRALGHWREESIELCVEQGVSSGLRSSGTENTQPGVGA